MKILENRGFFLNFLEKSGQAGRENPSPANTISFCLNPKVSPGPGQLANR